MGAGSRRDPTQTVKYRLLVRRRAKADVRSAARRYELQRPGLGREFVSEVDAELNRVAENPLQYQVLHRGVRRVIVHRFPYGIFYRVDAANIIVFSVIAKPLCPTSDQRGCGTQRQFEHSRTSALPL